MFALRFSRPRFVVLLVVLVAMLGSGLIVSPAAEAAGPPYNGPETQPTGPAYFGPAPNPLPYCENPTYFDPFPENVNPIGQIDVTGAPNASVTTDGVTMTFELTTEGDTADQYPGFFPEGGDGGPGDQPKGIEMARNDAAQIRLSEPLFYTQWVFTDVDQANEGFFVDPIWGGAPAQLAVFGGDANFDFTGTTNTQAIFNDTDASPRPSESLDGRVQIDLLGASTGLDVLRDVGSGQSGFAVGGGCAPIGVSKAVTSGPTWNGSSFDVTYSIRVRNNLPSTDTITADIAAARAAAASSTASGDPFGIDMTDVTLTDLLTDDEFSTVTVISNTSVSGNVVTNQAYNGDSDISLLVPGEAIGPETEEEFIVEVQYVPAAAGALGATCAQNYDLLNTATAGGDADGVAVLDLSDEGLDPDPGVDNGAGGNDDPTTVSFPCPPVQPPAGSLDIVKTVLAGAGATCPGFDAGVVGDGTPVEVTVGDVVTYCISVRNTGGVDLVNVVIDDPQAAGIAAFDGDVGTLAVGADETRQFDLTVAADTPLQNTAGAIGLDPNGDPVPRVTDTAVIDPQQAPVNPAIALTKTVLAGAQADCSTAVEGTDEFVLGEPGDDITWCFVVTNTGDVALTNVLFTDAPAAINNLNLLEGAVPPVLAVGDSINFSEPGTIPATGVDNVASVVGEAANPDGSVIPGVPEVDDTNTAQVNAAALTLSKTVAAGDNADCATAVEKVAVNIGTAVTYCFTIANTGGVAVRVTEVDDPTLGVTIAVPAAVQDLAPGASVTVAYSTIATTDLVNTAQVNGVPIDPNGVPFPNPPTLNPTDPAEVEALQADVSLIKSNNGWDQVVPTQEVPYTLAISNAGPDAAVGVTIVDVLPPGLTFRELPANNDFTCTQAGQTLTCDKATDLGVGETVELGYFVVVDLDVVREQTLINTASVTADTPDPDPTDNQDDEPTEVPPASPITAPEPPDEPLGIVTISNPPPSPRSTVPAPVPAPPAPPLAVTGNVHSNWLILAATVMTACGGTFFVAGRRFNDQAF